MVLIDEGYVQQNSVSLTAENENNVYKPGDIVTFTLSYVTSPPPDENNIPTLIVRSGYQKLNGQYYDNLINAPKLLKTVYTYFLGMW